MITSCVLHNNHEAKSACSLQPNRLRFCKAQSKAGTLGLRRGAATRLQLYLVQHLPRKKTMYSDACHAL